MHKLKEMEIKELKEEIKRLRALLDLCYIDENMSFEMKLKISEDMDVLIVKYYKLMKFKM
ncbi:Spo0E family sporulation regulatory protein-aspartic acid phosphatase [Anaerophilus nitritogenes]|uniref:Spo0E family sporulation regulatory protein-aspartic acid phosphatase n=1 Tax=Anaerophilus nitritogenes TaxID=2498136 RepID=UPI00101D247B|nr:Spo0E family sporulation regulatory protein-aspartic acid phosphatase [Anaerophilus nitritogenes]